MAVSSSKTGVSYDRLAQQPRLGSTESGNWLRLSGFFGIVFSVLIVMYAQTVAVEVFNETVASIAVAALFGATVFCIGLCVLPKKNTFSESYKRVESERIVVVSESMTRQEIHELLTFHEAQLASNSKCETQVI